MMPVNHASAVADYDFGVEAGDVGMVDIEMVSHTCAQEIKRARIAANLTQAQLA